MDLRSLEIVLNEQKEELKFKANEHICSRKEEALVDLNSHLAQVVTGVRRSGKSTLCYNVLYRAGVNFGYVDFDDERLIDLTSDNLNDLLQILYKVYGDFTHLFLDEIQNVKGWHLFVNRLLRQNIHIVITGSNAKLLSSELATHLTGRHHTIELLPFSFSVYCDYKGIETTSLTTKKIAFLRAAFDEYIKIGGFPETLREKNNEDYINDLVQSIVKRDIFPRHKIRYGASFLALSNHLLDNVPCALVNKELQRTLGLRSDHTVENYVNYLEEAYLIAKINRYSTKSSLRVRNEKCYPIDVALMNNRQNAFAGENLGWRLETIVFLELRRRSRVLHHDIYYFQNGRHEVDFVECKGNTVIKLYQVSYDISKPKTFDREINAMLDAHKATRCDDMILITDHEQKTISNADGSKIEIVPAYLWLTEDYSPKD